MARSAGSAVKWGRGPGWPKAVGRRANWPCQLGALGRRAQLLLAAAAGPAVCRTQRRVSCPQPVGRQCAAREGWSEQEAPAGAQAAQLTLLTLPSCRRRPRLLEPSREKLPERERRKPPKKLLKTPILRPCGRAQAACIAAYTVQNVCRITGWYWEAINGSRRGGTGAWLARKDKGHSRGCPRWRGAPRSAPILRPPQWPPTNSTTSTTSPVSDVPVGTGLQAQGASKTEDGDHSPAVQAIAGLDRSCLLALVSAAPRQGRGLKWHHRRRPVYQTMLVLPL